jgi:hypothetical protein
MDIAQIYHHSYRFSRPCAEPYSGFQRGALVLYGASVRLTRGSSGITGPHNLQGNADTQTCAPHPEEFAKPSGSVNVRRHEPLSQLLSSLQAAQ